MTMQRRIGILLILPATLLPPKQNHGTTDVEEMGAWILVKQIAVLPNTFNNAVFILVRNKEPQRNIGSTL